MSEMKLRPITKEEWEQYKWEKVSTYGAAQPIYARGIKRTAPPDDGYVYVEATRVGDSEQKWKRAMTPDT